MSNDHSLKRRMQVVYWGIPLLVVCTVLGGLLFLVLVLVAHWFMVSEFHRMAKKQGYPGIQWISLGTGSLLIIGLYFECWWVIPLIAALLVLSEVFHKDLMQLQRVGIHTQSWIYISLFLASMVLIRQHGGPRNIDGAVWILLMLTTVWICDTAAYWGGSKWGESPLHSKASPKKTVEGFIFGAVAALIWALVWTQLPGIRYNILDGFALGVIVGSVGQAGDLVESLYKRQAEVKDTSTMLGGHGGVLDRFDSILFVAPVLLAYILISGIWV